MRPTLVIIICLLMFIGCRNSGRTITNEPSEAGTTVHEPAVNNTSPAADQHIGDSLVFALRRTACFGTCPSYSIHVYESGHAVYVGNAHVERLGEYHGTVGPEMRERLLKEADEAGFFQMEAVYDSPVTDLPSTIITMKQGEDTKEVKGRVSPPPAFKRLAERMETELLSIEWRPVRPQD